MGQNFPKGLLVSPYWLLWVELYLLPKLRCWSPKPKYLGMTLLGNRFITDVINEDEVISMDPNPIWLISLRKGELWTHKYSSRKNAMWRWRQSSTSKGMPKTARKPAAGGREAWNRFLLTTVRRNSLCQHLRLRLLGSRTVRQLTWSQPVHGSPSKLIQWPVYAASEWDGTWNALHLGRLINTQALHTHSCDSPLTVHNYHQPLKNPLGHWIKCLKWSNNSFVSKENPFINMHRTDHRVKNMFKQW